VGEDDHRPPLSQGELAPRILQAALDDDIRLEAGNVAEKVRIEKEALGADNRHVAMRSWKLKGIDALMAPRQQLGDEPSQVGLDPTDDALVNSCEE